MDASNRLYRASGRLPVMGIGSPVRSGSFSDDVSVRWRDVVFIIAWIFGLWIWATALNLLSDSARLAGAGAAFVPMTVLFWRQPEYGVVTLMFFASGYLPSDFVDLRIPVGGFEMRDMVLFLMLGLMFFRRLVHKRIYIALWPAGGVLVVFLIMVALSALNAIYFEHGSTQWTLSEVRLLSFYAVFFVVSWGITNEKSLFLLIIGSFIIADITGIIILLQQYLGPDDLLLAAMEEGGWSIYPAGDATRVVPPGIVYLYFMMLVSISFTIHWGNNAVRTTGLMLHTVFAGLSLLFTFTRSAWTASAIALSFMAVIALYTYRHHILRILIVSFSILLLLVGSLGLLHTLHGIENRMVSSIVDRFTSIFEADSSASLSLEWRDFESQQALKSIEEHPLLGVGLGNSYRHLTVLQHEAEGKFSGQEGVTYEGYDRFTRFAHSSYLNLTVKMGIPAVFVLVLFYLISIAKGAGLYHRVSSKVEKSLLLAITVGLCGLLQWSIFHSQLMDSASASVVGLLIGVIASLNLMRAGRETVDVGFRPPQSVP